MIKKICDVCKNIENNQRIPDYIVKMEIQKQSGWEYILGRKDRWEICADCFDRILKEATK